MYCCILVLCVFVFCRFWSSDHLMDVRRWLLDFVCAIVVANVFVVLLCQGLTTAESRVKVWRR